MKEKKKVRPLTIERIYSTAEKAQKHEVFEKHVITGNLPVPEGYIRCIVLVDYRGMIDQLYKGDVLDLPDRRFKTLSQRGMVEQYKGNRIPNKLR